MVLLFSSKVAIFRQEKAGRHMSFHIRPLSWHKRRKPTSSLLPIAISVPEFEPTINHACMVYVKFSDSSEQSLMGRVMQNPVTGKWSISAIDHQGHIVLADYLPDS